MSLWNWLTGQGLEALLETSWQASILAVLVVTIQWFFRRFLTARWNYLLWILLITRLLLPIVPESSTSLYRVVPGTPLQNYGTELNPSSTPPSPDDSSTARKPDAQPPIEIIASKLQMPSVRYIVWSFWFSVALALTGTLIVQNLRFIRELRSHGQPCNEAIQDLALGVAIELGLKKAFQIVETTTVKMPAVIGLFRPVLLLPAGLSARLSEEELRIILQHELSHIRRGDLWINFLASLLSIIHWFNPILTWAFRRMQDDRELATDALAISVSNSTKMFYGETLLKLLSGEPKPLAMSPCMGLLENQQSVLNRIQKISALKTKAYRWSPFGVILLLVLGSLTLTKAPSVKKVSTEALIPAVPALRLDTEIHLEVDSLEKIQLRIHDIRDWSHKIILDINSGASSHRLDGLEDGKYWVLLICKGYASQYQTFEVHNGVASPRTLKTTLFKDRYAIIRYCINESGQSTFNGPSPLAGTAAFITAGYGNPKVSLGWALSQSLAKGIGYGKKVMSLDFLSSSVAPASGIALRNEKFDDIKDCQNDHFQCHNTSLMPGMVFTCKQSNPQNPMIYGKFEVLDIVDQIPSDMEVYGGKGLW